MPSQTPSRCVEHVRRPWYDVDPVVVPKRTASAPREAHRLDRHAERAKASSWVFGCFTRSVPRGPTAHRDIRSNPRLVRAKMNREAQCVRCDLGRLR
jgi:hypothetical protein